MPTPLPSHIPAQRDAAGRPVETNPPCGGTWHRDADGSLWPGDATTARFAGLHWPDEGVDADGHADPAQAA